MNITVKKGDPAATKGKALAVFLCLEDVKALGRRNELAGLAPVIGPRLKQKDFEPKPAAVMTLFPEMAAGPERLILVGLGPEKKLTMETVRRAAAKVVLAAQELRLAELAVLLPPLWKESDRLEDLAENVILGAGLGNYRFSELKSRKEDVKDPIRRLTVLEALGRSLPKIRAAIQPAEITLQSVVAVRDLVNKPANMIYPESLAAEARALARGKNVSVKVLDMAAAEKRGMGAFLGVAQGGGHPGRIIVLEYKGAGPRVRPIALVGKAITFDSGGLSLKPAEGMGNMKTDMAGGAVVLGVMIGAAQLGLKKNLVGIIPAAENMPDGKAYRPGDVLTSMSGLTVEITNTDAEGRLVLADGLALAREYKPKRIIDLATLTGACVVALGEKCAGLMGNADGLIEDLRASSEATGERIWPLPLFEDYFEIMKSEVADFKNAGARWAGTITAGLFLQQFVGDDVEWAHLDIAGPARADKESPGIPAGATGFGVHLLLHYLRRN